MRASQRHATVAAGGKHRRSPKLREIAPSASRKSGDGDDERRKITREER